MGPRSTKHRGSWIANRLLSCLLHRVLLGPFLLRESGAGMGGHTGRHPSSSPPAFGGDRRRRCQGASEILQGRSWRRLSERADRGFSPPSAPLDSLSGYVLVASFDRFLIFFDLGVCSCGFFRWILDLLCFERLTPGRDAALRLSVACNGASDARLLKKATFPFSSYSFTFFRLVLPLLRWFDLKFRVGKGNYLLL